MISITIENLVKGSGSTPRWMVLASASKRANSSFYSVPADAGRPPSCAISRDLYARFRAHPFGDQDVTTVPPHKRIPP